MAKNEILTDDYVAGILARDAKESATKYSALGLEAFSSQSKYITPLAPRINFLPHVDLQRASPSQTLVSSGTSSKIPIATMQLC